MSEPSAPTDETGEALSRLASYGEKKTRSRAWGPLVLIVVLLVPLAAVAWIAWQGKALQDDMAALRLDNAALQQQSAANTAQLSQARQQLEDAQRQLQDAQQQQQEQGATVQQTLEQELATGRAALARQSEQFTAQSEQLTAQSAQLAALDAQLAQMRSRLDSLGSDAPPLADVEALLRFAQQRLVLARDVTSAIELFQAADELLRARDDPALADVRESLAREVAALRALPTVDVSGLFARLSAEAARVDTLAIISNATVQDFDVTPAGQAQPSSSDWWTRTKQAFGEYFVVTRNTGAAVPQPRAEDQFQVRALVQLPVEQAKLALLRGEQMLYQAALDEALEAGRRWLRSDSAGFDDFMAALQMLRDTPITIDIPAGNDTLTALRRVLGTSAAVAPVPTNTVSDEAAQ